MNSIRRILKTNASDFEYECERESECNHSIYQIRFNFHHSKFQEYPWQVMMRGQVVFRLF